MIRVVISDDEAVVRGGLRMILESEEDIAVVGEGPNGREAVALVRRMDPDVVLMDIRMPLVDGIEATRALTQAGIRTRVVVLTTYGLDENLYAALKAGAAGFLLKTDSPEEVVRAVRVVGAGSSLLGPDVTRRVIERFLADPPPREAAAVPELAALTDREIEVLQLVAKGLSNAEIAEAIYVSEGTVKTHVARVLSKLGVRDRVQAVVFAYESGLVRRGRPDGRGR